MATLKAAQGSAASLRWAAVRRQYRLDARNDDDVIDSEQDEQPEPERDDQELTRQHHRRLYGKLANAFPETFSREAPKFVGPELRAEILESCVGDEFSETEIELWLTWWTRRLEKYRSEMRVTRMKK